ncbi:MAG: permease [Lachnoclostridium sp.]|nr:permease [Lachnoclostridium sp.]
MNIKQILKRYRVFLILFTINLVISLVMPEIGLTTFSNTAGNIKEMISVIPPIFILLGLLDVWVDRATMIKYTGKGSGIKGVLISFLLGSAAAGPLYAAFPVATVMLKKGSSIFNVLVFLGAWSTTKIPLLTFEAASLGMRFMLTRLALSVIGILVIALLTDKTLNDEEREEIYNMQG